LNSKANHGNDIMSIMRVTAGVNDLKTLHPELMDIWDDDTDPSTVSSSSQRKVWWHCRKDPRHRFKAVIANMVRGGQCKVCTGHFTQVGVNDLFTTDPELRSIWDSANTVDPTTVNRGSYLTVRWSCPECGRSWSKRIRQAALHPKCPYCSGRRLAEDGSNSLAAVHPEVVEEWDIERNGCSPYEITSPKLMYGKVWWKCRKCGKSWRKVLHYYIEFGSSCPYCNGKLLNSGVNDLATVRPDIAAMWNHERNGSLKPNMILPSSEDSVWWVCGNGHEWRGPIADEVAGKRAAGCQYCKGRKLLKGFNDLATVRPDLAKEWNREKNVLSPDEVTIRSGEQIWWKCARGHEWRCSVTARAFQHYGGCVRCNASSWSSKAENEIGDYVESLLPGVTVIRNDRLVLGTSTHGHGREIDVTVPSLHIGIEYNGLHWHSVDPVDGCRTYHYDKWLDAGKAGFKLLQIWEDDWLDRKPIVKDLLRAKLAPSTMTKTSARKMKVVFVGKDAAADFLDANHIQGKVSGCRYVMLVDENGQQACMAWRTKKGSMELVRYASRLGTSCRGGLGRCLKHAVMRDREEGRPVNEIVTFSDHCVSDGGVYSQLGFHDVCEIGPDYKYVVGKTRVHKFLYRISRFRNDPDLEYRQGMSEAELARLNGLDRIYDAGKTKWVKPV